jgi:hypothetical protein
MRREISQAEFEAECVKGFPLELQGLMRESRIREESISNRMQSNLLLATRADQLNERMRGIPFDLIESDHALREKAQRLADLCSTSGDIDGMRRIAEHYGIEPPDPERHSRLGQYQRLSCPRWWRRKLRVRIGRVAEDTMRAAGLVRRGRAPFVTDFSLRRRRQQLTLLGRAIRDAIISDDSGLEVPLADAVAASIANPRNRRTELMVRLRGLEAIARKRGDSAIFVTLTAPSAFHAQRVSGGPNPRYAEFAVRTAMRWLNGNWQRSRSAFHRLGILVYGFRIAEPHHDGTPHFHVLLFAHPSRTKKIADILKSHWLSEYRDEPGAESHRVDTKDLDLERGSVVGYLAKYIAKNIDGYQVGDDNESMMDASDSSERVDAWASTHSTRQFQQIGGPPVGLWRELRRLRFRVDDPLIERAREAADQDDYAGFVEALGGIELGRRCTLTLWREQTGELTMYGEVRGPVIAGIRGGNCRIRTRAKTWRIRWGTGAGTRAGTGELTGSSTATGAGTRAGTGELTGSSTATGAGTRAGTGDLTGSSTATGAGRVPGPVDLPGPALRPVPGRVPGPMDLPGPVLPPVPGRVPRPVDPAARSSLDPWQ